MLELVGITVRRHQSLPPVLEDVSLSIDRGDSIALVGANGSGKSTLARVLAGVIQVERGHVRHVASTSALELGSGPPRVGLVLQDPAAQAIAATVADDIAFGPEGQGVDPPQIAIRVSSLLARLQLGDVAARDPHLLSGGQQQRLAVASVLACDVDLLVLDEPTAHLDGPAAARFRTLMREVMASGIPVVWVTQDPADHACCQRTIALDGGAVAYDGPTASFVADAELARLLGVDLPPAARIVHELAARGAWRDHGVVPVHMDELERLLVASAGAWEVP